ncbi:MAG: aminoglycoside phosphotransferase family protein [Rhodospirillales bacterium]
MNEPQPPQRLLTLLRQCDLVGPQEVPAFSLLPGGVSSNIWRVDMERGPVCIKRALPKLKVATDWYAPIERNAYEVAWFQTVARIAPNSVPEILFHDPQAGLFVMPYLPPKQYPSWKSELRHGRCDTTVARSVGEIMARIHLATTADDTIASRFATDHIFHAIRLEPYLQATADVHPDLRSPLMELVTKTAVHRRALVHGDISPKNILVGPEGPVLLDAECAWYGDPAFDLAFCLNHFLLKCLWVPDAVNGFLACFDAMHAGYSSVHEDFASDYISGRAARLLPGLMLGQVDGKSPVEYLTKFSAKERVRRASKALLIKPPESLADVRDAWVAELKLGAGDE